MLQSPVSIFAARAGLFAALQCGICAAIFPLAFQPDGYMSSTIDKHARLAATGGQPRFVLAGGSATAFGIDSRQIEDATGRKATNLAIHAGLSLPVIVSEMASAVRPGDLVWVALEFDLFWSEPMLRNENWAVICARPQAAADLRWIPAKTLLDQGPFQFARHVGRGALKRFLDTTSGESTIYTRGGFNERGDFVGHEGKHPVRPLRDMRDDASPVPEQTRRTSMQLLQRAVQECERKGAEVHILLPPLHADAVRGLRPRIEAVVADLERLFPGRLLGTIDDSALPDRYFYDTVYHLTPEAAAERTRRLLAQVRR